MRKKVQRRVDSPPFDQHVITGSLNIRVVDPDALFLCVCVHPSFPLHANSFVCKSQDGAAVVMQLKHLA